jgi:hypothetical protein
MTSDEEDSKWGLSFTSEAAEAQSFIDQGETFIE